MQENHNGYRPRKSESLYTERDSVNDLEVRQAEQTLRHRGLIVWSILLLYSFTLIATFTLFYLAGLGILEFGDTVLISLSGVVVGELSVGVILIQIVKSIFPNA